MQRLLEIHRNEIRAQERAPVVVHMGFAKPYRSIERVLWTPGRASG